MNIGLGDGGRQCESHHYSPLSGRKLQKLINAQKAKKAKTERKRYNAVQTEIGGITVIPVLLTRGYHALVSESDYERVMTIKWHAHIDRDGRVYAVGHDHRKPGRGTNTSMHRFIMDAPSGSKVDHKDGDGLHNWRENLRICTNAQNIRNQRPRVSDKLTSKFKGVSLLPDGRYRASIMRDYRKFNLGAFVSEEDAARAYDAAAIRLHGAYARLNFPSLAGGVR